MSLPCAAKGYRFLRVGEKIEAGDFMPDGPTWEPVADHLVGTEVMGTRWSGGGEGESICRPRKRSMSKAQEIRAKALRAIHAINPKSL